MDGEAHRRISIIRKCFHLMNSSWYCWTWVDRQSSRKLRNQDHDKFKTQRASWCTVTMLVFSKGVLNIIVINIKRLSRGAQMILLNALNAMILAYYYMARGPILNISQIFLCGIHVSKVMTNKPSNEAYGPMHITYLNMNEALITITQLSNRKGFTLMTINCIVVDNLVVIGT